MVSISTFQRKKFSNHNYLDSLRVWTLQESFLVVIFKETKHFLSSRFHFNVLFPILILIFSYPLWVNTLLSSPLSTTPRDRRADNGGCSWPRESGSAGFSLVGMCLTKTAAFGAACEKDSAHFLIASFNSHPFLRVKRDAPKNSN